MLSGETLEWFPLVLGTRWQCSPSPSRSLTPVPSDLAVPSERWTARQQIGIPQSVQSVQQVWNVFLS